MSNPKFNKTLVRSIMIGVLALVAGIFISKLLSKNGSKQGPKISFASKSVEVISAQPHKVNLDIQVSGRLKASSRQELYSEVTGVLNSAAFKAGNSFAAGQLLIDINSTEFEAQLKAQKSSFIGLISQNMADIAIDYPSEYESWKKFLTNIDPNTTLPALPSLNNQQLKQFLSTRAVLSSYYTLQSQEERLKKHKIHAPYSGVLSEALIDPGTLVRAGQKMGTFVRNGSFELEASVSRHDLQHLKIGNKVQLHNRENSKNYVGTISRINAVVNPNTQMVNVYLSVEGAGLKEGMYLTATIHAGEVENALKIKRNLLVDNTALYSVSADSSLHLQEVEVLSFTEQFAIVQNIEKGTLLVNQMMSGAFEGMKVTPSIKESK